MPKKPKPTRTAGFTPAEIAAASRVQKQASRTPAPVLDAFAGAPITCGDLAIAPLTLASFMLLERIDSPLVDEQGASELTTADIAAALLILSQPVEQSLSLLCKDREAFDLAVYALAARLPATELPAVGLKIRAVIEQAFSTVIAGQKNGDDLIPEKDNGLGWGLTLLDTLMSEYGWKVGYTLRRPLVQAFALYAAISARYGNEPAGPTYADRALLAALQSASSPS